jgi:hypothetical protein
VGAAVGAALAIPVVLGKQNDGKHGNEKNRDTSQNKLSIISIPS